jgi:formylglycine-generating enzyme required for sulfatase activity
MQDHAAIARARIGRFMGIHKRIRSPWYRAAERAAVNREGLETVIAPPPQVFVSYASQDEARALAITRLLEESGVTVWFAPERILAGEYFGERIVHAIKHSRVLMLMCSPHSMGSDNVQREVDLTWRFHRRYLPVWISPQIEVPDRMLYALVSCQWIDAHSQPTEQWLPKLLRSLRAMGVEATNPARQPGEAGLLAEQIQTLSPAAPSIEPECVTTRAGRIKLKLMPAGEFMMGSDDTDPDARDDEVVIKDGKKQKHRVRITRPFYLGVTEVTRGQFRAFVDDAAYKTEAEKDGQGGYGWDEGTMKFREDPKFTWLNPGFEQTDGHPVVNVSWNDAAAFCEWLKSKEGQAFRLPTEAEWEYACRAGTTTRYASGDDPETLALVGNVADATAKDKHPAWSTILAKDGSVYTAPVGRFHANAFGLYDMHGNVWEWCLDFYDAEFYQASAVEDPVCSARATGRVYRGGIWGRFPAAALGVSVPRLCRSAKRGGSAPGNLFCFMGFRVARGESSR